MESFSESRFGFLMRILRMVFSVIVTLRRRVYSHYSRYKLTGSNYTIDNVSDRTHQKTKPCCFKTRGSLEQSTLTRWVKIFLFFFGFCFILSIFNSLFVVICCTFRNWLEFFARTLDIFRNWKMHIVLYEDVDPWLFYVFPRYNLIIKLQSEYQPTPNQWSTLLLVHPVQHCDANLI